MATVSNIEILSSASEPFIVNRFEAEQPMLFAVFAVGRGGNPARHHRLLQTIANRRCTVIAPHFDMMASTVPTKIELDKRIRRLEASIDSCASSNLPIVGIGHSIGATVLLAVQGAKGESLEGHPLIAGLTPRFERLALMAPPTNFSRHPGALDNIRIPLKIWVGAKDIITPPAQSRFLMRALAPQAPVTVQVDPDAGHFTYMDELPPNFPEPHPDRSTFLAGLADEITAFLVS